MTADATRLLPSPSHVARDVGTEGNGYADDEAIANWPVDSATVTVSEIQRGETTEGAVNARVGDSRCDSTGGKCHMSRLQGGKTFWIFHNFAFQ